jgi:hypothetical protein
MTRLLIIIFTLLISLTAQGQATFKEKGSYDKEGNCKGTWKYFSEDGILIKSINYDTGEKKYYSTYRDPHDDIFEKMKLKADSFLLKYFDKEFIANNIKWEPNESYYYGPGIAGRWFEPTQVKPNKFLFRFNLIFDQERIYHQLIRFELDEYGNLIHVIDEDLTGIAYCKAGPIPCKFNTTYKQALDTAESHGLKTKGKTLFYLDWRKTTPKDSIFGEYEIVVAKFREKKKKGNRTTYYYDAVIINPWTGKFKKKVELKSYTIVHTHSAFSSGLKR